MTEKLSYLLPRVFNALGERVITLISSPIQHAREDNYHPGVYIYDPETSKVWLAHPYEGPAVEHAPNSTFKEVDEN